jgi:hypothetical protein
VRAKRYLEQQNIASFLINTKWSPPCPPIELSWLILKLQVAGSLYLLYYLLRLWGIHSVTCYISDSVWKNIWDVYTSCFLDNCWMSLRLTTEETHTRKPAHTHQRWRYGKERSPLWDCSDSSIDNWTCHVIYKLVWTLKKRPACDRGLWFRVTFEVLIIGISHYRTTCIMIQLHITNSDSLNVIGDLCLTFYKKTIHGRGALPFVMLLGTETV